jgi:hypothetical protein
VAAGTVALADSILLPLCEYLASREIQSWFIAVPMFILNLPAIPLATLFSIRFEDSDPPSLSQVIAMQATLVLVSGMVWGKLIEWRLKARAT